MKCLEINRLHDNFAITHFLVLKESYKVSLVLTEHEKLFRGEKIIKESSLRDNSKAI